MRVCSTKSNGAASRSQNGFTLIEMIGVLAVIAILAAVLIPKVFEAINNARVNNAAMTVNAAKTACIDHYAKYGTFPVNGSSGTAVPFTPPQYAFDNILLKEQFMDKPFVVKIGDGAAEDPTGAVKQGTHVEIIAAPTAVGGAVVAGVGYNLAGGTGLDDITGSWLVQAVITGVAHADAIALNNAIDGTTAAMGEDGQGQGAGTGTDLGGRVVYGAAVGGTYTVYIYLTHR